MTDGPRNHAHLPIPEPGPHLPPGQPLAPDATGAQHATEAARLLAEIASIDVTRIDTVMDRVDVEVRSQAALTHAILADVATRTDRMSR